MKEERREFLSKGAKLAGGVLLFNTLAKSTLAKEVPNLAQKGEKLKKASILGKAQKAGLAKSDPEFLANLEYFAEIEVPQNSEQIKPSLRAKLSLCATIAAGGQATFKSCLENALDSGVSAVEIKELVYQSTAYVGLAKSLDYVEFCNTIFKQRGIKLPLTPQQKIKREQRQEAGLNTQRAIFGEAIDKGNAAAPADLQHIRRYLSSNCFGDYYTRGGLELEERELFTLVYLIALGGVEAQLKGHIQGNLNMGKNRAYLIEVITALVPYIGYPRTLNALTALDALTLKK